MSVKLISKIKISALIGFIALSSAYAQDAVSGSHVEHHPKNAVAEKKSDGLMENGMKEKMDMKSMMVMMNDCKKMHKDSAMCDQDMMEKCHMKMDKKECQMMMKKAKAKEAKK